MQATAVRYHCKCRRAVESWIPRNFSATVGRSSLCEGSEAVTPCVHQCRWRQPFQKSVTPCRSRSPRPPSVPYISHQPRGSHLGAVNVPHRIRGDTLRSAGTAGFLDRGPDERGHFAGFCTISTVAASIIALAATTPRKCRLPTGAGSTLAAMAVTLPPAIRAHTKSAPVVPSRQIFKHSR
jgi:hypothetical protein